MKGKKIISKRAYSLKYYFFKIQEWLKLSHVYIHFPQVLQQKILLGNTK